MGEAAESRRLSDLTVRELREKAQSGAIVRFSRRDKPGDGDRRKDDKIVDQCNRNGVPDRRQQQKEKLGTCLEFHPSTEWMTLSIAGESDWPIPIRHLREWV